MSISVQYDKNAQKMVLKTGNDLVATFDAKEANQFRKEYEQALLQLQIDYRVEKDDYAQIIMEDLDLWLEESEDIIEDDDRRDWYEGMVFASDVIGINIEVNWLPWRDHSEDSIYLLKENGAYESLDIPDNLTRNFTDEQIKFGQASSYQIRRCFDENVLKLIEATPDFVVKFCDVEVPRACLFGDEKELFFDFGTSSE